MIPVTLNHVALDVADRRRSIEFYSQLLSTEVVAEALQRLVSIVRVELG